VDIVENHSLAWSLGEQSPLARVYDLDGHVLLLGVGHANNTSLHLAEYRADFAGKQHMFAKAPMLVDGQRQWVSFQDIGLDSDDFVTIGADFARDTGQERRGKVGSATAILVPQRSLIDYAVRWMEKYRKAEG
jgi:aminoglycoside 3-N-acetyltransferase